MYSKRKNVKSESKSDDQNAWLQCSGMSNENKFFCIFALSLMKPILGFRIDEEAGEELCPAADRALQAATHLR